MQRKLVYSHGCLKEVITGNYDAYILQVKSVQDAIRDKQKTFLFSGVEIRLTPTVGLFITMNPGYAGRTELPENLKALFR